MVLHSTKLILPEKTADLSEASCHSYIGGYPRLPAKLHLPTCGLCGSLQTFFFQVTLPEDHVWRNRVLSFFQCTSCYDRQYSLQPYFREELLPPEFKGFSWDRIPRDFPHALLDYIQINWKVIVFSREEGVPREDYPVRIGFVPLKLKTTEETRPSMKSRIGGEPGWAQGDVRPLNCDRIPMNFLMQWKSYYDFLIIPGAPPQHDRAFQIAPDSMAERKYYTLFNASFIYVFGCIINGKHHVLVWPQSY